MINKVDILNDNQTEIAINKAEWAFLLENYTKEEIKAAISETIDEYKLDMPLRKISHQNAVDDFELLLKVDTKPMIKRGDIFTRYDYRYKMSHYYIEQIKTGNVSSDYFQQYNRFLCDSQVAPSPYRSWYNPKFRNGVLNALFTLKYPEVNNTKLRSAIGLRKYIAAQFKPSVAKCFYDIFEAKHVLDFSSGWGDRLSGFYSAKSTISYVGIDPNARLYPQYKKQEALYSKYNKKETELNESCAENFDFSTTKKKFDFIFTSPPYFNIEKYTQEENQSWKKYRKFDVWLNDFLFATLKNAWEQLEEGGILAINISDVYSGHRINNICDPMNDFISSLDGAFYMGCLGMKMSKRPNNKTTQKTGTFVEPVWFFSKNKKMSLDNYLKSKNI
jgi:hypothetical protein